MSHNNDPQDLQARLQELGLYAQMAQEGSSTAKARLRPLTEALLPDFATLVAERFGLIHSTFAEIAQAAASGNGFQGTDEELDSIVKVFTTALTSIDQLDKEVVKLVEHLDA